MAENGAIARDMDPIWIFQNLNFSLFSITPFSLSLSLSQLCRRHYHNNQHAKPSLLHWLHLTPAQHCWTHCQLVFSHCLLFLIDKLCLVAWKKKENKLLYNYFLLISSCWFWSLFCFFFFFFFWFWAWGLIEISKKLSNWKGRARRNEVAYKWKESGWLNLGVKLYLRVNSKHSKIHFKPFFILYQEN